MHRRALALALICAALAVSACGTKSETTPPPEVSYYKDIKALVEKRCTKCHFDGGIAPFALKTYDDLYTRKLDIREAVEQRLMPPWPADDSCAEYTYSNALTQSEIDLIVKWVNLGAPEGDPQDEPLIDEVKPPTGLERVDVSLQLPKPYTMTKSPDDYRCFVLEWPKQTTTYVTGFQVKPGEPRVVHHMIAFVAPPSQVAHVRGLDAAEPDAPGYTCYGGPGAQLGWIGAWAPGGPGGTFPTGTGIKVEPGSVIVIQMHYNDLTAGALPDQTTVEFMLADSVTKPARLIPYTNPVWLGGTTMKIPANEPLVTHSFESDPTGGSLPITIHLAMLHMHQLGSHGRIRIKRADGSETCVLDVPRWDFHWQLSYPLKTPVTVNPGDKIYLECNWNNTADFQPDFGNGPLTPRDVYWGDGSTDEMCLGIFYVTTGTP